MSNKCSNERISDMNDTYTHQDLLCDLTFLAQKYPMLKLTTIGHSVMKRPIPALKIGNGNVKLLYVGTHHGLESITSALLIKFAGELCEHFEKSNMIYGIDPRYIYETRCIYMIPMLNPDGVELCRQANANGVDLNHNYDAGFEEYKKIEKELGITGPAPTRYSGEHPESEPETKAICSFIRALTPFKYIFTFHTQGEEIYSGYNGYEPKNSIRVAKALARYSGYIHTQPEHIASYGGLKDWYVKEFDLPAFTIECGRGKNPLPMSELVGIYIALRKMFFHSLIL